MADEVTLNMNLALGDDEDSDQLGLADVLASLTTAKWCKIRQTIGTSEEAMKLGENATLGWCLIRNLDSTNYVELRMASGASNDHIKIPAGKGALFYFGSDVTAPFLIANTASCEVVFLLTSV